MAVGWNGFETQAVQAVKYAATFDFDGDPSA